MVKLRLRRMGSKRRPVYDIVVADSRYPRDGRFIEKIGQYNPVVNEKEIILSRDRALYWVATGAQPTDTVKSLLKREGVIMEYYLTRKGVSAEKIAEQLADHKLRQERKYGKQVKPAAKAAVAPPTETPANAKSVDAQPAATPVANTDEPVAEAAVVTETVVAEPNAHEAAVTEAVIAETTPAEAAVTEAVSVETPVTEAPAPQA